MTVSGVDSSKNVHPLMTDANGNLKVIITDGTHELDITSSNKAITQVFGLYPDNTNQMPSGDAIARPIFTKITDGTYTLGLWENGGITAFTPVAYRIRNSREFFCCHCFDDVADAADVFIHIKVDSTVSCHGNLIIEAEAKTKVFLYENPTTTDDGTALTELSMNRETLGTPVSDLFHTPTVGADGTLLECGLIGSAGKFTSSGGAEVGAYWAFKPNEEYLVKMTNESGAAADICFKYRWHEHLAV